jgi:hypothetical protein
MAQRNELAMRARNVGLDPTTIPNDSKLEQKILYLEKYSGAVTGTAAVSTLTSDNTELADGDTVTIGPRVYRFKDTLAQIGDVKRDGTTADTTLANLVKAINGTGTPGTEWYAGTMANGHVSAAAVSSHATIITSRDTNANGTLSTTTTAAHLSWTGTTLGAGTAAVAGIIAAGTNNSADGSAGGVSGARNTSI